MKNIIKKTVLGLMVLTIMGGVFGYGIGEAKAAGTVINYRIYDAVSYFNYTWGSTTKVTVFAKAYGTRHNERYAMTTTNSTKYKHWGNVVSSSGRVACHSNVRKNYAQSSSLNFRSNEIYMNCYGGWN